jgi:hypothetical protein
VEDSAVALGSARAWILFAILLVGVYVALYLSDGAAGADDAGFDEWSDER